MSIQDNKPDMEENSTAGRRIYGPLFWTFLKIGAFTFGGGWAMISIIEREIVDKHHWIRREEFLDLLAVSQSLPGILAVNISVTIAIFLTPDIIKDNAVVSAIFKGIRPCVVALIIAPVLTSARSAKIGWRTVWIPVAVALMIYFGANPIWFILLGGVGGWLWLRRVNRRIREASENNEEKGGER